ncbi:MAG: Crp/Fnr family transcriptional regulator [Saprospiraceae bacterium]|nr:Crp/Fnr family transcriptional regulator [Pyrinomonadaceae bacterium]
MAETPIPNNRLLAALPKNQFQKLFPRMERVDLVYDKNIYQPGEPIRHVYFPEKGIISLLATVGDDYNLEVGIVGNEGMAGLPVFMGVQISSNCAVVQGSGFAYRMATEDFLEVSSNGSELPRLILRYMHSLFTQVAQSAACNRYHPIDERLARWLMMTHDRMHAEDFAITQEFLSNMLGVRREAVNKAAKILQERGLIKYSRGHVTVIDGPGLEKAACRCYGVIKKEYDSLSV